MARKSPQIFAGRADEALGGVEVILLLFLISVGVLEAILWKDRKEPRDSTPKASPGTEVSTLELLQLLRAVQNETPTTPMTKGSPEYNRENVETK
jgi:hypothetical protein